MPNYAYSFVFFMSGGWNVTKQGKKPKRKVEEPPRVIIETTPIMTESERLRVKKDIEQKLYNIFKKYY